MRCQASGFAAEKLQRELRDMLLGDGDAVTHALFCQRCGSRDTAVKALALADWDELDYLEALARHHA